MYNFTPYTPIDLSVMNSNNTSPADGDVLCGRGSTCYKHAGNKNFRFIIAVHLPKYTDPLFTRKEKGIMIQNIVNDLQSEGRRFLKEGITGWEVLCHKEAKYKVGHALRDAASEMKKHIQKHTEAKKAKKRRRNKQISSNTSNNVETIGNVSNTLINEKERKYNQSQLQVSTRVPSLPEKKLVGCKNDDNLIASLSHLPSEKDNACDDLEALFDNISTTLFDDDTDMSLPSSDEGTLFDDILLP